MSEEWCSGWTDSSLFQKAGLVWGGAEETGEEGEVGGGGLGGLGGLHQWMSLMTEHVAQDTSRLPFLWPGLSTGNSLNISLKPFIDNFFSLILQCEG